MAPKKVVTEDKQQVKKVRKERGQNMNMYGFMKFVNGVLLVALFYTYLQYALLQKEFTLMQEYGNAGTNTSIAGNVSKPNLPKIENLRR